MFAIGNDELSTVVIKEGDIVKHRETRTVATVEFGTNPETGKKSDLLAFVTFKNGKSYLVGVKGKLLVDKWEKV